MAKLTICSPATIKTFSCHINTESASRRRHKHMTGQSYKYDTFPPYSYHKQPLCIVGHPALRCIKPPSFHRLHPIVRSNTTYWCRSVNRVTFKTSQCFPPEEAGHTRPQWITLLHAQKRLWIWDLEVLRLLRGWTNLSFTKVGTDAVCVMWQSMTSQRNAHIIIV